jgi:hypothetical protein
VAVLICWGWVAFAITFAILIWLLRFLVWVAVKIIKGD